ncbi:MAG: hypothetical protein RIS90_3021 [Pseudomonadota bacterium]
MNPQPLRPAASVTTPPIPEASARHLAQRLLCIDKPVDKAAAVRQLDLTTLVVRPLDEIAAVAGMPGVPQRPPLVPPQQLKPRSPGTREGRAALIHALAHIEANAINLALDVTWRFAGMPERFYRDWLQVACEEALHFELLREHLLTLGFDYGDFPAHNGLWEMAQKTETSLLARLALVPRTLEARGLDASVPIRNRLVSVGDHRGAAILDIILRDEIGHVAIGNHWYRHLCSAQALDPIRTFAELAARHGAQKLKGPFNLDARRAAGFDEAELALLGV